MGRDGQNLEETSTTHVPNPPLPKNLTHTERKHLETFDELDVEVFTHADWKRGQIGVS